MAENLMEANFQWATRRPDERFFDVPEFAAFAEKQAASQAELTLPLKAMEFVISDSEELFLRLHHGETEAYVGLNSLAFRQLASRLDYPTRGLDPALLSTQLIADVLNHRLRACEESVETLKLLTETNDLGEVTVKSVTSESYARFSNKACVPFLQKLLDYGYRLPPARPVGMPGERIRIATEKDVLKHIGDGTLCIKVGDEISPAGLYCGQEDFFAVFVNDSNLITDDKGEVLMPALMLRNSDLGVSSFELTKLLIRKCCSNHILWGATDIIQIRYRHVGDAVKRIHEALYKFEPDKVQTDHKETLSIIRWMSKTSLGTNATEVIDNVVHLLGRRAPVLTQKLLVAAYQTGLDNQATDLHPSTWWGMFNAVTRYSQTIPYQNVRKEVDKSIALLMEEAKQHI